MKRKRSANIVADFTREERIKDIKETIKLNQYLINYYRLLLDNHPENHLSFQSYLKEIDKRAEAIKEERRRLIATFDKASNGEIPSLQQQQEELQKKLKQLQVNPKAEIAKVEREARRMNKKVNKAEWLGKRIKDLEEQLRDENFDVEELLQEL